MSQSTNGPEPSSMEDYAGPGLMPQRWGRMDQLSRLAVETVGRVLEESGLLQPATAKVDPATVVGLIAATRYGSLATDLEYCRSLAEGFDLASPALFGYTLPNIGLAEAAGQFGLTGPVYAIFSVASSAVAEAEAKRWLSMGAAPTAMLAGVIDVPPDNDPRAIIANFTLLRKS